MNDMNNLSDRYVISQLTHNVVSRGDMSTGWFMALVVTAVVTVTAVVGNVVVLVALRRMRRAPAHYPFISLASADLLVGVSVLPIAAARELFAFQLSWPICACWSTLDVLCCTASILSLCALGWVRWSGITAPLACARRARLAKTYAGLVWPVSAGVALPTAFIPSPRNYLADEIPKACSVNINVGYVFFSNTFSFYIPTIVMLVMYTRILVALASPSPVRAHRGKTASGDQDPGKTNPGDSNIDQNGCDKSQKVTICPTLNTHLSVPTCPVTYTKCSSPSKSSVAGSPAGRMVRQRRASRTIILLMTLFLVCWTPFFVMLPIESVCECVWDSAWQWCTWLGYANSALNPLVYAAASPGVRRALRSSLTTSSSARTTDVPMSPGVRRP